MTDDLLTNFRSEMPMPDDDTTKRVYENATKGERRPVQRRRLVIAIAVLALAGIAVVLGVTLGGSKQTAGTPTNPHPGGPGGVMALAPFSLTPHVTNGELTSLDVTLRSTRSDNTLEVKVVRQDGSQVVFTEQVTPTVYDSAMQDATHASWSGTLTPSDWTGGCQSGLYRIEYAFGPDEDTGATDWFRCTGIAGPTGATGPTGSG
jgi:hypothetical protein